MNDAKLRELINMLLVRTAEARLHWVKSGIGGEFEIRFAKGRVTIDHWVRKGIRYVSLSIYNDNGAKIHDFKFNDQADGNVFELVFDLYSLIEKKYLESDVTLDTILEELKF